MAKIIQNEQQAQKARKLVKAWKTENALNLLKSHSAESIIYLEAMIEDYEKQYR